MKKQSRLAVLLAAALAFVTLFTGVAFATAATELNATREDVETALSAEQVQAQLVYNQLLECATLEDVFNTMMLEENRTGVYALNEEQLNGLYQFVQNMYAAIAEPTEDDTYYYNDIVETLQVIAEGNGVMLLADQNVYNVTQNRWFATLSEAVSSTYTKAGDTLEVHNSFTETTTVKIQKDWLKIKAADGKSPIISWTKTDEVTVPGATSYNCIVVYTDVSGATAFGGGTGTLTLDASKASDADNKGQRARVLMHCGSGNLNILNGIVITGGNTGGGSYDDKKVDTPFPSWSGEIVGEVGFGSGIYMYDGTLNMSGGIIRDNYSLWGATAADRKTSHNYYGGGGGVYLCNGSTMNMSGGTITHNAAGSGGGGGILVGYNSKLNMTGGTVSSNVTNFASGGGIGVRTGSEVKISGGNIQNNYATGHGGGLFARGDSIPLEITGGTFDSNTAGGYGGGVLFWTVGDDVNKNTVIISDNAKITNNKALYGGGVSVGREVIDNKPIGNKAKLIIKGNPQITGNSATINGGGIHMQSDEFSTAVNTVEISGGNISNNSAVDGGGIYVPGGTVTVSNAKFEENEASSRGAGIFTGGGTMTINSGAAFSKNIATGNGGGVFVQGGDIVMNDGRFMENKAANGGGAYVNNGNFTMSNGTINSNIATSNGGAVYMNGGNFTMKHGSVDYNSAVRGGAVYMAGTASTVLTMQSGTMNNNTASDDGGAIFATSGTLHIGLENCPGAIRNDAGEITDNNYDDHAQWHGNDETSCPHPQIQNNEAADTGGGIAVENASNDASLKGIVHFYCGDAINNKALYKGVGKNVFMDGGEFHYYNGTYVGVPRDPDLVIIGGKLEDHSMTTPPNINLHYFPNNTDEDVEPFIGLAEEDMRINLPEGTYFWDPPYENYTFVGWTSQGFEKHTFVRDTEDYLPSGTPITVTDTESKSDPSTTFDGDGTDNTMKLYAIWAPATSEITYVDSMTNDVMTPTEGSQPATYTLVKAEGGSEITVKAFEKDGYAIVGWYLYQDRDDATDNNANWGDEYEPEYVSEEESYAKLDYDKMADQYIALDEPGGDLILDVPSGTFGDITLVAKFEPQFTDLTIKKTRGSTVDGAQSFIFKVTGTPSNTSAEKIEMEVIIALGADDVTGSITIPDLPVGTYSVSETGWSWRYEVTSSKVSVKNGMEWSETDELVSKIMLEKIEEPKRVEFTNTRSQTQWLDGEVYADNNFTGVSTGEPNE